MAMQVNATMTVLLSSHATRDLFVFRSSSSHGSANNVLTRSCN